MQQVPLDRLLAGLPGVAELAPLREAVVAASLPDPQMAWAHASVYATYDKRVLEPAAIAELVRVASAEAQRRVERLYEGVAQVLEATASGDHEAVVAQLVLLGESAEEAENWEYARTCFAHAAQMAAALPERRPLALALRRVARVRWNLGEVEDALAAYAASLEQADAAGDREGRIIALTGLGNMRTSQGRWSEARADYLAALASCTDADARLRGQLYLNLANLATEQRDFEASRSWLQQALELWDVLGTANHCVWLNNHGMLCMEEGDYVKAELAFTQALEHAPGHLDRAMVLDNLADLTGRRGQYDEALVFARRAEEHALAAGSPWALGLVYTDMGKIFRLRGDANGVTFFEKALEICRERTYPLVEGLAHLEYGIFRREIGEREEAASYLERAREIFAGLGAQSFEKRALDALATLAGGGDATVLLTAD